MDVDGDGIEDCLDLCPGIDDNLDEDHNGEPDCLEAVPTVSEWGIVIMALALLTMAKLRFRRRCFVGL